MASEIFVSEDNQYIIIKTTGEINVEIAMKQNVAAHQLGRQVGINRFLVDVREARNTDSVIDQHEFANKSLPKDRDIDKNARIAALISKGDTSHHFVETFIRNAGFDFRLFDDFDNALEFLLEELPQP